MWRETGVFLRRHWLHLLLLVPGALLVTVLHEAAHALAVLLQGGTILEFVWLPTDGKWGHVAYDFPALAPYSAFFISIAPYLLWLLLATVAVVLSLRRRPRSYWKASFIYFWLFVAPLADIANAAFPYLAGSDNDFWSAFGPPSWLAALVIALLAAVAVVIGYWVQRRLYREHGLGIPSYLALSGTAVGTILVLTMR